MTHVDCDDLIT